MKCANCHSPMFVTDETVSARSQVTFYRCSLCVAEHVSSEPILDSDETGLGSYSMDLPTEPRGLMMT